MNSPFALLSLIIAVPFIGLLFALTAKDDEAASSGRNVLNVSIFAIIANIILIFRIFMLIDTTKPGLQLVEKFNWLENPQINIMFGADVFSMLLILAVHLAVLIGFVGVRNNPKQQKTLMVFSLLFLSMSTGFFVAADIFSFYIFFEAMLLPLFMLCGIFGEIKKSGAIYRFFHYNFVGALILFSAVMILYHYKNGAVEISLLSKLPLKQHIEYYIWAAVFLSFLSRIPVWPFHSWLAAVSSGIKNPLVFIIANIMPLTGVYGFIRFLPKALPDAVSYYLVILEVVAVITMLFIALIGFIHKDSQYKIFAYVTVYYVMYLLGIMYKTDLILLNIGYSVFSYLIIVSGLAVINYYIHQQQEEYELNSEGFLCMVPKVSFVYSYLILAGIGLPLSSLFLNNFLILSKLMSNNIKMGMIVVFSLVLVAGSLLQELYKLRNNRTECAIDANPCDISPARFAFMIAIIFVLIMSFIKPLWFVVGS